MPILLCLTFSPWQGVTQTTFRNWSGDGWILARQVLVQWSISSPEEATWEWLSEFKIAYPSYHLEDKVIFEGEGNDTPEPEPNGDPRPKSTTSKPEWHKAYVI
ncbi:hypothetical protein Tco_0481496 [Tanacetum coccineum]